MAHKPPEASDPDDGWSVRQLLGDAVLGARVLLTFVLAFSVGVSLIFMAFAAVGMVLPNFVGAYLKGQEDSWAAAALSGALWLALLAALIMLLATIGRNSRGSRNCPRDVSKSRGAPPAARRALMRADWMSDAGWRSARRLDDLAAVEVELAGLKCRRHVFAAVGAAIIAATVSAVAALLK